MNAEENCFKIFAVAEKVMNSSESTNREKASAWRKQTLLIQHLLTKTRNNEKKQLLQQHFQKRTTTMKSEYLQQRVQRVEKLLKGCQKCRVADEYPNLNNKVFEAPCRGYFESCKNTEITAENLNFLKKTTHNVVQEKIPPKFSKDNDLNINMCSSQRPNSILHFIQPQQIKTNSAPKLFENQIQKNNEDKETANPETNKATSSNSSTFSVFRTAREELVLQNLKKYSNTSAPAVQVNNHLPLFSYNCSKKSLGGRRTVRSSFVPPVPSQNASGTDVAIATTSTLSLSPPEENEPVDERLKNIDPKMVELITSEIMHKYKPVAWEDIAGLEYAKSIIKEAVVYPLLRPDIFTGLRRPPRGILLFGPPGTGKTLIGKCIASHSKSTFFSISASSLTSKWVGDGEKMVRALFAVAAVHQPSVVFIDEIDSLLSQRSESEHESSRRLKNEFLIQLDGAATSEEDRILIVGATNRPQELDEAARRRLVRRLYIPLPESDARLQILNNLLSTIRNSLTEKDLEEIGHLTEGYSGADMDTLCREASMEPIRSIPTEEIPHFKIDNVRPINMQDFHSALRNVRPSVSKKDLLQYTQWNSVYGACINLKD